MHGSMIITSSGGVYQEIGIPRPPGLIPVIPKYRICRRSPWRRPGASLCRVIKTYGPKGLAEAIDTIGARQYHDPLYGASMPYIREANVIARIGPIEALEMVVRKPRGRVSQAAVELAYAFKGWTLGLTGTTAIGAENNEISDVDLIVATQRPSRFLHEFTATVKPYTRDPSLSWRRGYYDGVHVSWVAAPREPAIHCPPLASYWRIDTPRRRVEAWVTVEPGQEGALLYPPCVEAGDVYIVSYEYNHGYRLYRGGRIKVRGIAGSSTIYIGVRETG